MEYIILMIIKILDNMLGTTKTILVQKRRAFLAAITVFLSQLIFFKIISDIVSSDGDLKMFLVSIASGIGTFIAIKLNEKFSKDKIYVINIFSDNNEEMLKLCDFLTENKIKKLVIPTYTKDWESTLAVTAFPDTREKNEKVKEFVSRSEHKYLKIDH